ncbi:glycosyltransferase family 4 protein [Clostridium perfringens]|uniref:glycosyltransferase family 4 protein n=1 Tax=Clostridium perfringens TaxID=1502 RepID=UPI0013E40404|nr:glycosyltransferase family 4 protein [Clostridium perfringens]NGT64003.1 glycosyltransferase family 4 protein [Clostridium perfringens]
MSIENAVYKKVIYIMKSDLHYYPPCVSQIRLLKKSGVNVEVWFGSSNKSAIDILDSEGISYCCLGENEKKNSTIGKLANWISFRKKIAVKIKELSVEEKKSTIFWIGTTESAIPLLGLINKISYVLTSLELLDDRANRNKRKLFGLLSKNAKAIISCEETRSYIMKYWYKLDRIPYTMPNKPYCLGVEKNAIATCEQTLKAISLIKGKKVIIYQGIFQNIEYMKEVAIALKNLDSDYYLVMMGIATYNNNIINILREIYDKVIYIESIPAPLHLEVTSHAYIGLVFYDGITLNKAFCAPNKIYEYSGFGIPAIANDIPGLKNTISNAGAGECVKFKAKYLEEAIQKINKNYAEYSKNAIDFYNSTDNFVTMKKIINDLNILHKD